MKKSTGIPVIFFVLLILYALTGFRSIQAEETGWALYFDGQTDFVELDFTADMFPDGWQSTKTVSLWIKPEGPGDTCGFNDAAWCDAVFGDRPRWWGISRGVRDGLDRIWVWNTGTQGEDSYRIHAIGVPYEADEWVHISLVHEGGFLYAYKNGLLVGSIASGDTYQPDTGAKPRLHLGGIIQATDRNWTYHGLIDEVRIYSIALSQQDILDSLAVELSGDEDGLQAYYRMSDGPPSLVLSDDSQYSWNGELKDGRPGVVEPSGWYPQWVASDISSYPQPLHTPSPRESATAAATEQATAAPTPLPTGTVAPVVTLPPPIPPEADSRVFLPMLRK